MKSHPVGGPQWASGHAMDEVGAESERGPVTSVTRSSVAGNSSFRSNIQRVLYGQRCCGSQRTLPIVTVSTALRLEEWTDNLLLHMQQKVVAHRASNPRHAAPIPFLSAKGLEIGEQVRDVLRFQPFQQSFRHHRDARERGSSDIATRDANVFRVWLA